MPAAAGKETPSGALAHRGPIGKQSHGGQRMLLPGPGRSIKCSACVSSNKGQALWRQKLRQAEGPGGLYASSGEGKRGRKMLLTKHEKKKSAFSAFSLMPTALNEVSRNKVSWGTTPLSLDTFPKSGKLSGCDRISLALFQSNDRKYPLFIIPSKSSACGEVQVSWL